MDKPYQWRLILPVQYILLLAVVTVLSGCNTDSGAKAPEPTSDNQQPAAAADNISTPANAPAASANAQASNPVKVELASFEELKSQIASFKDRVVVVDAWSTSCVPCMKEFPHLVALARRWPEDVVCVSINLNYSGLANKAPESYVPEVTKFLQSKTADAANMLNLVSTVPDEQMYGLLEIESIPAIFVYDRQGTLAGKLTVDTGGSDGLTYEGDVIPLVEKLIEK